MLQNLIKQMYSRKYCCTTLFVEHLILSNVFLKLTPNTEPPLDLIVKLTSYNIKEKDIEKNQENKRSFGSLTTS